MTTTFKPPFDIAQAPKWVAENAKWNQLDPTPAFEVGPGTEVEITSLSIDDAPAPEKLTPPFRTPSPSIEAAMLPRRYVTLSATIVISRVGFINHGQCAGCGVETPPPDAQAIWSMLTECPKGGSYAKPRTCPPGDEPPTGYTVPWVKGDRVGDTDLFEMWCPKCHHEIDTAKKLAAAKIKRRNT